MTRTSPVPAARARLATALVAAAALSCAAVPPATAAGVGTPTTYSNLVWFVSLNASGLTTCDQLVVDATGDLLRSDALVLYGALNCNPGAYGVTGSAFSATDGTLHLTLMVAGYTVSCPRLSGYAGTCTVYDADWVVRGSGRVQLL
jgi:hypothetical protein